MERKKKNTVPAASAASKAGGRVVLVGTYKGDQLTKWRGWYNYPISEGGGFAEENSKSGRAVSTKPPQRDGRASARPDADSNFSTIQPFNLSTFQHVTELWLFQGTKDERRYKAEFVGVKTRQELIRDYGYPARGKAHGEKYLLFKTEFKYRHKGEVPEDAERVIIRTADFARSPKVRKQLKAYLESPDRSDPDLAKRLPEIITRLRPEQLRVCEAAVQYYFLDIPSMKTMKPPVPFPPPKHPTFTFIGLFAGIGGFRIAMQRCGGECVFTSEFDPAAQKTYEANFGDKPFGDITKQETHDKIPEKFDVIAMQTRSAA